MMKAYISNLLDALLLFRKYRGAYFRFFAHDMADVRAECKRRNIRRLSPAHLEAWKLQYGTAYFRGVMTSEDRAGTKVFIKVQGPKLLDCFFNEVIVNKYIYDHSPFLSAMMPALLDSFESGGFNALVYEHLKIESVHDLNKFHEMVGKVLDEYRRIGIIHTDFGLSNMGEINGQYYFFDYGTAICPRSDTIRIRSNYNHLDMITERAKNALKDAAFYYDDAVHFGISHNDCNYLAGDASCFIADLGNEVVKYHVMKQGNLYYMHKQ